MVGQNKKLGNLREANQSLVEEDIEKRRWGYPELTLKKPKSFVSSREAM